MDCKKVLVCSISAWNKKSGADTFSTLMEGYDIDKIANLYIREDMPDSSVCSKYFRISENAVIKSIFKRRIKTGKQIILKKNHELADDNEYNAAVTQERYRKYGANRNYLLLCAREVLWMLGKWKSHELNRFIDEFQPDTVFFAMEGYIHFNRICRYIIKRTDAKGVGYFWDDNFTYKQKPNSIGYRFYRYFQRNDLKKTVKLCHEFFAIAPKTKSEADAFFGINCKILTKPIDFTNYIFQEYKPKVPLKLIYTGKLIIGRLDTVKLIGRALDEINKNGVKVEFDIYTTTHLNASEIEELSPYIHILGSINQTEVFTVQKKADVLVFAEALEGESAKIARLSFSTKITDYFRSGKCIFAVGNAELTPIEYLRDEDAAVTATSYEEILCSLTKICTDSGIIREYAEKAFKCGMKNHDKQTIQKKLFEVLCE